MASEPRPLTSGDVAALFGADRSAVSRWADDGLLPHFRTPGGHLRFHRHEVEALLVSQVAPIVLAGLEGVAVRLNIDPALEFERADLELAVRRGLEKFLKDRARRG